jgi:hypothetical protein
MPFSSADNCQFIQSRIFWQRGGSRAGSAIWDYSNETIVAVAGLDFQYRQVHERRVLSGNEGDHKSKPVYVYGICVDSQYT